MGKPEIEILFGITTEIEMQGLSVLDKSVIENICDIGLQLTCWYQCTIDFLKEIDMKTDSKLLVVTGALFLAGLVGGCTTGASSSGSMGGMSGMGGMGGGQMDMAGMCEKHNAMMAGKSKAEQQTMMNEHMKSMSPEMQTRMKAMHEKCPSS